MKFAWKQAGVRALNSIQNALAKQRPQTTRFLMRMFQAYGDSDAS